MLLALCAALLVTGITYAEPTDQEKAAARKLGWEGDDLWDQGDYAGALDRFERAFELAPVPLLAVRRAECLEKLGRWVEASNIYHKVAQTPLDATSPQADREAVSIAEERRWALSERLPLVTVSVTGEDLEGATLYDNGQALTAESWNVEQPVDPGKHVFRLVQGKREAKEVRVELAEGGREHVQLFLPGRDTPAAETPPAPPPPLVPPASVGSAGTAPPPPDEDRSDRGWKVARYTAFGVGAAGLTFGAVAGGLALGKVTELDGACDERRCDPDRQSDVDQLNQWRNLSTAGFAVGAVGTVAWVVLLQSKHQQEESRVVQPWVGLGSVGATVRF